MLKSDNKISEFVVIKMKFFNFFKLVRVVEFGTCETLLFKHENGDKKLKIVV